MKPSKVRKISFLIIIAGFLMLLFGDANRILLFLGIAVMAAGLVFDRIKYRCPYCLSYLGRDAPDYCPRCGMKIDDAYNNPDL